MEVVLPLDGMSIREKCPTRKTIEQLLRGFNFLHTEGLIHGGKTKIRGLIFRDR